MSMAGSSLTKSMAGLQYRAAVLSAPGSVPALESRVLRQPASDEVIVQVLSAGLCGSDLFLQDGGFSVPFPVVPGHEASGRVVETGAGVTSIEVGDLVALHYIHKNQAPVGDLEAHPHLGEGIVRMGVDTDGALADYVIRPASTLVKPDGAIDPDALAVLTDAVATPYHALAEVLCLQAGERVGVIGLGGIGSNAVQIARILGAEVIAVGRSARSRDLALRLGANHVIEDGPNAADQVRAVGIGGLDAVVVATDAPGALRLAVSACRPRGRVALVAASRTDLQISSVELIWPEVSVTGSRGFTISDIRAVQSLYLEGKVTVDHLVSDIRPLGRIGEAFSDLRNGGSTRILIHPGDG